ncbi:MAG: hypothetical protein V3U84_02880 [Thiotrichaceae bacterium]
MTIATQDMEITDTQQQPFFKAFNGSFKGVLRWEQLDELWERVKENDQGWYIYAVGETPPDTPSSAEKLQVFIPEIDALLHQEHDEDYCGIVYADDHETPSFIKIFDPNNLGTSCGTSSTPPLPSWILSKIQPIDLPNAFQQTGSRRRWWQKIFS